MKIRYIKYSYKTQRFIWEVFIFKINLYKQDRYVMATTRYYEKREREREDKSKKIRSEINKYYFVAVIKFDGACVMVNAAAHKYKIWSK